MAGFLIYSTHSLCAETHARGARRGIGIGGGFIRLQPIDLTGLRTWIGPKYAALSLIAACFVALGFAVDAPAAIAAGLLRIVREPAVLITDYMAVGGVGAALVNSGLLMLFSTVILRALGVDIGGLSVAAVFLMGGFGLFGKNVLNVWPIILGVLLYARIKREPFRKYVHVAFLSTSIAPIVTELMFVVSLPAWGALLVSVLIGVSIGVLIVPLSHSVMRLHRGFNLYNIGFAVGLLGTVYVSVFKSYGYAAYSRLIWSIGNDLLLGLFLAGLFLAMIAAGFGADRGAWGKWRAMLAQPGVSGSDFIEQYGFGPSLVNMGVNGLLAMGYILLVGGALNGPTVGGILTVAGFGAFGKHLRNILPLLAGVFLGSVTKVWNIDDPAILIAALFGTSLAPISGYYGWFWGVVAGFINSSVVLNSGILHGGMSLYNTGFAAGIVATVMIPLLDAFAGKRRAREPEGG